MTLSLEEVSFARRGRVVLSGISARIAAGRLTCVVGPNAAGKTTLLQVLSGECRPTSGRYLVGGVDARRLPRGDAGGQVAIVPQDVRPPPYLTVSELVALGRFRPHRAAWRRPDREDLTVIRSSLSRCRAEAIASRPVEDLSGGEQRRAWLAFGLARGKRFLLLDETLDGLDVPAKRAFFEVLREAAAEGTGVVLTTHDLHLVGDYADAVMVLGGGRLVYHGPAGADLERFVAGPDPGPPRQGSPGAGVS